MKKEQRRCHADDVEEELIELQKKKQAMNGNVAARARLIPDGSRPRPRIETTHEVEEVPWCLDQCRMR